MSMNPAPVNSANPTTPSGRRPVLEPAADARWRRRIHHLWASAVAACCCTRADAAATCAQQPAPPPPPTPKLPPTFAETQQAYATKYAAQFARLPSRTLAEELRGGEAWVQARRQLFDRKLAAIEEAKAEAERQKTLLEDILTNDDAQGNKLLNHVNDFAESIGDLPVDTLKQHRETVAAELQTASAKLRRAEALRKEHVADVPGSAAALPIDRAADDLACADYMTRWMHVYVYEQTPRGQVIMRFNAKSRSFEYFTDATVPYAQLLSAATKYAVTVRCRELLRVATDPAKSGGPLDASTLHVLSACSVGRGTAAKHSRGRAPGGKGGAESGRGGRSEPRPHACAGAGAAVDPTVSFVRVGALRDHCPCQWVPREASALRGGGSRSSYADFRRAMTQSAPAGAPCQKKSACNTYD